MTKLFLLITILFTGNNLLAGETADDILGIWRNPSGKGHVQIYKENGRYFGKLVWLKKTHDEKGRPYLDTKNPNQRASGQPLLGLVMLSNFSYDDGEWTGGKIYNPEDGKEYKSYMKLKDAQTLFVRGFVGISWIGKTLTFQRVK